MYVYSVAIFSKHFTDITSSWSNRRDITAQGSIIELKGRDTNISCEEYSLRIGYKNLKCKSRLMQTITAEVDIGLVTLDTTCEG